MNIIIQNLLKHHEYSSAMIAALQMFSEGNTSSLLLKNLIKEYHTSADSLRWEAVNVIVDYIELILEDNILSPEEMHTLRMIKKFFHVQHGDFLKQHKEVQIEHILYRQLSRIYQDNHVDNEESLMKVDLQELFDLSYDQFLRFEKNAVKQALENGADIKDLDTIYKI